MGIRLFLQRMFSKKGIPGRETEAHRPGRRSAERDPATAASVVRVLVWDLLLRLFDEVEYEEAQCAVFGESEGIVNRSIRTGMPAISLRHRRAIVRMFAAGKSILEIAWKLPGGLVLWGTDHAEEVLRLYINGRLKVKLPELGRKPNAKD